MSGAELEKEVVRQEPTKIWNRTFISLFFANLAFNMGLAMSNSLISVYVNSMGAAESTVGMVMASFTISSILLRLVSSPIMDTYNRKYIVVFAATILSVAFFGFSISKDIPTLMAFRLLQGAGMAFGNACCLAMVSEALPKDKYNSGIGYYSLAQVMCQAIGPMVGLTLSGIESIGYKGTFAINGCVMLVAALLALMIKVNFKRTKKLKISLNNIIAKEALIPTFMMFILATGGGAVGSFLIIFAATKGITSNIGLYFTTSAVMMLITRPFVGKLIDKFGIINVLVPALFCNIFSFVIISCSTSLVGFLLAAVVAAFGQGACQPAIMALSMKTVTNDRRGAASSTNYIGMDMGVMVGPVLAGNVAQAFGYVTMWRVMTIPFFVGMAFMLIFRKVIMRIEKNFSQG